ncbi:MAG TPA: hypothetical protein PKI46_00230 [Bacteroidales bacterium]|nr:hypothetical protein [Bacteroidales bacterium]
MAKISVTITKNEDGTYTGKSYYNHCSGLASIGGGVELLSKMSSTGEMIRFTSKPHIYKEYTLFEDGKMIDNASKTEKMHFNAHLKELNKVLHPETVEQPIYKKYIVLENGHSMPKIEDAREIKNSLEIKGQYCTCTIRSGVWIEATEDKMKWFKAYIEKQEEFEKIKKSLFAKETE